MLDLTRHEKDQLKSIGESFAENSPYWWGKKTMPKLAAKGLVEPHPDHAGAWRITDAGAKEFDERNIKIGGWL